MIYNIPASIFCPHFQHVKSRPLCICSVVTGSPGLTLVLSCKRYKHEDGEVPTHLLQSSTPSTPRTQRSVMVFQVICCFSASYVQKHVTATALYLHACKPVKISPRGATSASHHDTQSTFTRSCHPQLLTRLRNNNSLEVFAVQRLQLSGEHTCQPASNSSQGKSVR